ncbi:patatin-like phospholipase family protein [Imtechella halotolerans]|uniref:Patatin n=1 Tax=Imtechella halotolerans K1 TaxID=946077 RepID=I0WK43_9FLAO|nr:patatin-like phospholipase family protein [Imtechella halotolerans]EID76759.1 patatin [Imtechella halotolerans K1]WMQ62675.1 patatin-like phospholipase family protein [Imtechella halotolerans]
MSKNRIGLVLSGGGVKSLAHAGLLQALHENDITPHQIAGTSGGALIGALYACGYKPKEMLQFFKETPVFKFSLFALNKPGIMDSEKYHELFVTFFKNKTFEELDLPLTVTATNLITGKLEYFQSGSLIKPLIASSALPPYFSPIAIGDHLYSDGGILNNFPIEPLQKQCNILLGSFVNPVEEIDKTEVNTTLKLIQRIYHIGMDASYYAKFKRCAYVFIPKEIDLIGVLDTKMIDKAYEIGYNHAIKEMNTIKTQISNALPVPP